MAKVTLFGLNVEVEFDENDVFTNEELTEQGYEECAVTTDGRLIAFDEAVCDWVQLRGEY